MPARTLPRPVVTLDDIRTWPPVVSIAKAASALGIGSAAAYAQVQDGRFSLPIVLVGGVQKVLTFQLICFLETGSPCAAPEQDRGVTE